MLAAWPIVHWSRAVGPVSLVISAAESAADPFASLSTTINPEGALGSHRLAQHLDRFTGHRKKPLAKAAVIAAHPDAAARACGVRTPCAWTVVALFLTSPGT
ncbi:hypothetical protein ACFYXH_35795 [Streptomyces sp. NPDC002730]|uniref:hypothetical protein n=1 Tax=Streptomyces sp. NPDC002730 TaxID=3364662 RepID=UPI003676B82D